MKAFICHYTPLKERKTYLENILPKLGFTDIEWVTEQSILNYDFSKVYDPSPEALAVRNKTTFSRFGIKSQRPLSKAEIEITLQHYECYHRILEQKLPKAVIFEDDVVFKKKFSVHFNRFLNELPTSWDIFYFGSGCGNHGAPLGLSNIILNILGKKHVFKNKECRSRFTDSYVISAQAADTILAHCFPFHLPIDRELNYLQSAFNMSIYWSEPTLSYQGSKYGAYKSNLKVT